MYLHLGQDTIVPLTSILGIFDLEITSQSKITRDFLANEEKAKHIINVSDELPRSFILCREGSKTRIYISQISPSTLKKRLNTYYLMTKV